MDKKNPEEKEDWVKTKWRPVMGWLYMSTCAFDFIIAPIGWAILQALLKLPIKQWEPLTLQGAGLYHLAMGAVLGVAAWSRGQEKITNINNSSLLRRPLARDTDEDDADNIPRRR